MINSGYKILFVTHYGEMYGANQSLVRLMIELRADYGVEPVVLLSSKGPICAILEENDIEYVVFHYYWWINNKEGIFEFVLNYKRQFQNNYKAIKIARVLLSYKFNLIYSNSVVINIGALISKKLKIAHIWHFRESLSQFNFKLYFGTWISKLYFKNAADKYILISDYLVSSYENLLPANKIHKIYNGISISNAVKKTNCKDGIIYLCMVGVISEQKNNLDAIKAIKILKDKYHIDKIRLHFIGGADQKYLDFLNRYIVNNNLDKFVIFHGHQSNVGVLLETMNLGLMCSRGEAFGRVSVEYMNHSMPVIASKSGANQEIVKEGISGYLYELYDADDLANNIYRFIIQPELLETLGESAYLYAKENFSSEKNTALIYKEISDVLKYSNKKMK